MYNFKRNHPGYKRFDTEVERRSYPIYVNSPTCPLVPFISLIPFAKSFGLYHLTFCGTGYAPRSKWIVTFLGGLDGKEIYNTDDLNNIKEPGTYWWIGTPQNAGGNDDWSYLIVKHLSGTRFVIQEIYKISTNACLRTRVYDNGTWGAWVTDPDSYLYNCPTAAALASLLNYVIKEVSVAQGEETEVSLGGIGFVFARDEFYNSYGALWFVHGNTILPVYEEDPNTLSVTNSSARLYCTVRDSGGVEYLKIKNNYSSLVKLKYKLIKL